METKDKNFLGIIISPANPSVPVSSLVFFTRRCPSVATAVVVSFSNLKRTPERAGFSSSLLTAKDVFSIRLLNVGPKRVIAFLLSISGMAGNSSAGLPTIS